MTGKERVLAAIHSQPVDRVPWVPFVGCHAASLIGVDAEAFFKSEELMVQGVLESVKRYRPDGIPALFDLQLEAEAMGCDVRYAADNPPSVISHPMEKGAALADLRIPQETDGRFPQVLAATRRIVEQVGRDVAVYGLITGPFTLMLHMRGTDIFYDMIDEPDHMHAMMKFAQEVCINTANMFIDAGVDVIAVVDPMCSQISPANFEEFVAPYLTPVYDAVRARGKAVSLFVCGDARRNVPAMVATHPDNLSIDENIPLEDAVRAAKAEGVSMGGNIKLTLSMLFGTPTTCIIDAQNCIALGGETGFILAPGCDLPFATPPKNIEAVSALVNGEMMDVLEDEDAMAGVVYELPDYANEKKVIVDVITLDSESCAPCQYMMAAVRAACEGLEDIVYIEHKIKERESVACMMKLGVSNIPTIVVDGAIRYISITPDVPALRKTLEDAIALKKAAQ